MGGSISASTVEDTSLTKTHAVKLTSLNQGALYYFTVTSKDASVNSTTSTENSFNTPSLTTDTKYIELLDTTPPFISAIKVINIADTTATITWTTNEIANSVVNYGFSNNYGKKGGSANSYAINHQVVLKDLESGTIYRFQINSADPSGNNAISSGETFTTAGGKTAEIKPKTEKPAEDSLNDLEMAAAVQALTQIEKVGMSKIIKAGSTAFVNEILEALSLNTSSIEEEKLIIAISEIAPKVVSAPIISGSDLIVEVAATTATIHWITDKKSNSIVAYAKEDSYSASRPQPYAPLF